MGDGNKLVYLLSVLGTLLLLTNIILFLTSQQVSDYYQKEVSRKKRSSDAVLRPVAEDRSEELERKFVQLDATVRLLAREWQALNARIENLEKIKQFSSSPTALNNATTNSSNNSIVPDQQLNARCSPNGCYTQQNVTVTECGGVITANSGVIQYKLNQTYNDNEYCAWTILTEGSSLELNLTKYGFYYTFDGVTLLNINPESGDLQKLETFKWKHKSPVQSFKTNSSHAIVIFSSNAHYTGKGFELQFNALGQQIKDVIYTASHHNDSSGPISINGSHGKNFNNFFRIITQSSSETDAIFSVNLDRQNLYRFNSSCEYEAFKVYELIEGTHLHQLGELSSSADKTNCPSSISIKVPRPWFTSSTGAYIAVMRVKPKISTVLTPMKEKRDMSISTACGGLVVGDSGYISYKEDKQYDNNENCTWYVWSRTSHSKIYFTVEKEGFELCCDNLGVEMPKNKTQYLSTRSMEKSNTVKSVMYKYSGTSVTFTSNGNNPGTGFRLKYKTFPLQTSDRSDSSDSDE